MVEKIAVRPMTPTRRRVYDAIVALRAASGLNPTIDELAAHLSLHRSGVHKRIRRLIRDGHLEADIAPSGQFVYRSIRAVRPEHCIPIRGVANCKGGS
jgi:hypothetical protein